MNFLEKILAEKAIEVENMPLEEVNQVKTRPSFYETVKKNPEKVHLLGEIKRASPSKGNINTEIDILAQAKKYQTAGVSGISVLTDEVFFKGSIEDLKSVSEVVDVPLLCKDFIIDQKQLIRAKNAGASMILLIVAALTKEKLTELYRAARALDLEVLVETHDGEELAIAQALGAAIIGVNNRSLKTFDVSIATSETLAPEPSEILYISESGFKTADDVARVAKAYNAVLVGETLMRAEKAKEVAQALQVSRV